MSEHVNKPDAGFKTQEEIKLKVSSNSASGADSLSQISSEKIDESQQSDRNEQKGDLRNSKNVKSTHHPIRVLDGVSEEADYPLSPAVQFHKASSSGLKRHKAIVATCVLLSCSFLALSAFDLKHLIGKQAVLSDALKLTYLKERPELPSAFTYTGSRYSDWQLDQEDYINEDTEVTSDNLVQVAKHTWDGRKLGYVNKTGKIIIPPKFINAGYFHEGLANAQVGEKENAKFGFIDESGNFIIPPKFGTARNFHNGAAVVEVEGRHGLIDKAGNYVVKPSLRGISELGRNFLAVTMRGKVGILSPSGEWLLTPDHGRIYSFRDNRRGVTSHPDSLIRNQISYEGGYSKDKIFKIWTQNQVGIIDENGKFLLPAAYDDLVSFSDGIAAVRVNGKIGFVKADGKYVIQPQFDQATRFADLIAVRNHSRPWSFIDRKGNPIKGPSVDDIITDLQGNWLMDGLGPFLEKGKVGYMNSRGEIAIKPQFEFGFPFAARHAPVWQGNCWKLIDTTGNFVPGLVFQDLSVFSNGKAPVTIPGIFYPLVENSKINAIRENIKTWKENYRVRQPVAGETWGEF